MKTFKQFADEQELYTEKNLFWDINLLHKQFQDRWPANEKVVDDILTKIYESKASDTPEYDSALFIEINRFGAVINTVLELNKDEMPLERLNILVEWLANNGNDPAGILNPSAQRRYKEIMTKLQNDRHS